MRAHVPEQDADSGFAPRSRPGPGAAPRAVAARPASAGCNRNSPTMYSLGHLPALPILGADPSPRSVPQGWVSPGRWGRPGSLQGLTAVRTGRRNPSRWRRCPLPSRTARRSRHGPHEGAGTRRTPPRSWPQRRRRATMPARGLGQGQMSGSGSWRRSWRKRPDSTAERRDSRESVPALPREAVNEEGPASSRYARHRDRRLDRATTGGAQRPAHQSLYVTESSGAAAIWWRRCAYRPS